MMATSEKTVLLEKILAQHKTKSKRSYIHWEVLRKSLGATGRKKLGGLTAKATCTEVIHAIEPFLGSHLALFEIYGECYLAENMTPDAMQREIDSEKTDLLLTILANHKAKEKKSFLKFNAAILKVFGYNTKTAPDVSQLAKIISPFLGSDLMLLKKKPGRGKDVLYLAYHLPSEEFVKESHQVLSAKKTFALKTLAGDVPLNGADFAAAFNRMLDTGQLVVTKIDNKFAITGVRCELQAASCERSGLSQLTTRHSPLDADLFHAAFEKLDHGRIYVRICNMRRELDWNEECFNAMLNELWKAGRIQLHAGDVSSMTEEDAKLSYTDEDNFFYASLTWKK